MIMGNRKMSVLDHWLSMLLGSGKGRTNNDHELWMRRVGQRYQVLRYIPKP